MRTRNPIQWPNLGTNGRPIQSGIHERKWRQSVSEIGTFQAFIVRTLMKKLYLLQRQHLFGDTESSELCTQDIPMLR